MKKFLILFVVLCGGIACAIIYFNKYKTPALQPASAPPLAQETPDKTVAPKSETSKIVSESAEQPAQVQVTTAANETKPDDSANSIRKIVDGLLTTKSGGEKQALFDQLRKSSQLDAVIAELKQRAMDNPNDAKIPTTLGEAQLNEIQAIKATGGDMDQIGILAMQADQSFNAALKIDPQNWEANFVKASSMYYWPAGPTRDADAVQRLSNLIDQQETMSPNSAFAQTYIVLGNEYQKIGQPDKAQATWQLGLTKFPGDATLQKKISGQ